MAKQFGGGFVICAVIFIFVVSTALLISLSFYDHADFVRSRREAGLGPTSQNGTSQTETPIIPPTTIAGASNVDSIGQETANNETITENVTQKIPNLNETTQTVIQTTVDVITNNETQHEHDSVATTTNPQTSGTIKEQTTTPETMQTTAINECKEGLAECDDLTELCFDLGNGHRCDCRPSLYRHTENGPCKSAYTFSGTLRILQKDGQPIQFDDTLKDPTSPEYQQLSAEVSFSLDQVFQGSRETNATYSGNQITGFRAGSVITTYNVFFTQDTLTIRNDVKTITETALTEEGGLPGGTLVVDADAVNYIWVNECLRNQDDCALNASCRDTGAGGFTCTCDDGLVDVSPPSLPGRICIMPTEAPPTEATTTSMLETTPVLEEGAEDEWETWLKVVIAISITAGIFIITVIVSLIHNCRVKRTQRLKERSDATLTKYRDEEGKMQYADYSYMYEQPISEPRSNEEVAYDADGSMTPSEVSLSELHSLAIGSFPPTPVPTPMPPRRHMRDASVGINVDEGEDINTATPSTSQAPGGSAADPSVVSKLTGILSMMQIKGRSYAFPFGNRQNSQETVDSNMGDESGDELRREAGDGGMHTGGREPADGAPTAAESKKMTFLNIPTDTSRSKDRPTQRQTTTGTDNLAYDAHGDSGSQSPGGSSTVLDMGNDSQGSATAQSADGTDNGGENQNEETSCAIM